MGENVSRRPPLQPYVLPIMALPSIFAVRQQNGRWLLSAPIVGELSCIAVTEVTIAELSSNSRVLPRVSHELR